MDVKELETMTRITKEMARDLRLMFIKSNELEGVGYSLDLDSSEIYTDGEFIFVKALKDSGKGKAGHVYSFDGLGWADEMEPVRQ